MDLIQLPTTEEGYRYCCVATEYLSSWAEVWPLRLKRAGCVAQCVMDQVYRYGAMEIFQTDQGTEFCNKLNRELCNTLGIKKSVSTAYHPPSQGLCERFNQTMETQLMKMGGAKTTWHTRIQSVAFAYRIRNQSSTQVSPFEMMYGVKPRLPIQLDLATESTSPGDAAEKNFLDVQERVNEIREFGLKNLERSQSWQKRAYDKKRSGPTYKIGDLVLLRNSRKSTRKGGKLDRRFSGPYEVVGIIGKGTYEIQTGDNPPIKASSNAFKPFYEPHEFDDWTTTSADEDYQPNSVDIVSDDEIVMSIVDSIIECVVQSEAPDLHCIRKSVSDDKMVDRVEKGLVLDDNIIDWAHDKISGANGQTNQSTLYVQSRYSLANDGHIQILHNGSFHWIATMLSEGKVYLANSLYSGHIEPAVQRQLKELYSRHSESIDVYVVPVQQQENSVDCGMFAIAFAWAWLLGGTPEHLYFQRQLMRPHLIKCIRENKISPFPCFEPRVKKMRCENIVSI